MHEQPKVATRILAAATPPYSTVMTPSALASNAGSFTSLPPTLSTTSVLRTTKTSSHGKRDSKLSVSSTCSHKEYLDSLEIPTQEIVEQISHVQEAKEMEAIKKRLSADVNGKDLSEQERERAAGLIQRNYRGYRDRRTLNGLSLDPSSRWVEAVKEVRYRMLTEPRPRDSPEIKSGEGSEGSRPTTSHARKNWKKIGLIARRAGGDEDSNSGDSDHPSISEREKEERREKMYEQKLERQKAAKMMDLQYFLEMVDHKHRYGSNLRTYHEAWKNADTHENFFYWLDYGEGRYVDSAGCSRERLEREQVRYLSKEERREYLVEIDNEGRLRWAKNGERIDTTEKFKDSIHGIVPDTDNTPAFRAADGEVAHSDSDSDSSSQQSHEDADDRANKYATPEFDQLKGIKKIKHVSAATVFNKLLRGSVKNNTWIFVADTSFRVYVGIKQSGAFQHSSFLHGSRISAAGSIKIKDGQLDRLSPLSGHYRPPVSNFRAFIHFLKANGVDMSHVSISRSYAVLVGLEAYVKTRRRGKKVMRKLIHGRDKLLNAEELQKREEQERDKTESAERERRSLELRAKAEEEERHMERADSRLLAKLGLRLRTSSSTGSGKMGEDVKEAEVETPGPGPENAIPPEGTRKD